MNRAPVPQWLRRALRRPIPVWQGQFVALGCIACATFLRYSLEPLPKGDLPFITFVPAVLVASAWGGTLAGISTVVLASAVAGYLWLAPVTSLTLSFSSSAQIGGFCLVSGFVIVIVALLRALLDSEERANLLAQEMTHRVRNVLGLV